MKREYGWRRFVLDERRGFNEYSTVMPSGGWRSGFRAFGRVKGACGGRVVDLVTCPVSRWLVIGIIVYCAYHLLFSVAYS
ncbi:hypothetical protein Hanom_Chr08g00732021 [Helianthus anomalus]